MTDNTLTKDMNEAWSNLGWRNIEVFISKMQRDLYEAELKGETLEVKRLQKIIVKHEFAKLKAVRQVTQDNRGKKTAGVDGKLALTGKERLELASSLTLSDKADSIKRVYIPKSNGDLRALGIPTIKDRATQALVKMALEPVWEARFEVNSYGFRPGRSCHDAIVKVRNGLYRQPKYILDADISKCFDKIDHTALLKKIDAPKIIKRQLKAWLKAGVLEGGSINHAIMGTPQGGVISPLLSNIALHGLEDAAEGCLVYKKDSSKKRKNRGDLLFCRYADDFIIGHEDLEIIENTKIAVEKFLTEMGLELSEAKTKITHTLKAHNKHAPGFFFLGFRIWHAETGRHHGVNVRGCRKTYKLLIIPEKSKVLLHLKEMKAIIRQSLTSSQETLLNRLIPRVRGWCNYYKYVYSKATFSYCDYRMWVMLERWAKRRHPGKGKEVVYQYWSGNKWSFRVSGKPGVRLPRYDETEIIRFVKVKGTASPFNGDEAYWSNRIRKFHERKVVRDLLKKQKGICALCKLPIKYEEVLETHHILPKAEGGGDNIGNLSLVHGHCHDRIHSKV